MKVLDITEFFSERGGGIRSYLTTKGQELCALGVNHRVLAPGPRDERCLIARAEDDAAEDHRATSELLRIKGPQQPYDPTYHFLTSVRRVHRTVLEEQPDVLEIHSPYMAAVAALSAPRASYSVRTLLWHTAHLEIYARPLLERRLRGRARERIQWLLWAPYRPIARRCAGTTALSHWQAGVLRTQGFPRVAAIPFGVRKHIFSPDARSEAYRHELLGPSTTSAKLIIGAGRLAAEKRWDVVMDAFLRYRQQHDAVLVILGDGPERPRLEQRVRGRDDVRFLGFEQDPELLAKAFASADALVHAAPAETFGITQAEALSCALPAVLPDAGALSEHSVGPSLEKYVAEDASACSAALARLLGRDPATVREAALRVAEGIGSVRTHFEGLLARYRDLLREAGRPPSP